VCGREPLRLIFVHHFFGLRLFGLRLLALQRLAAGVALVALDNLPPTGMLMSAPAPEGGLQ